MMNNLVAKHGAAALRSRFDSHLRKIIVCRLSTALTHRNEFRPSDELAKERYNSRVDEDIEKKKARLLYQSKKRGMLENGVILSSFAEKFLHKLDPKELDHYDQLINLPTNDWDIYYWATKTKPTPPEYETEVMQKLRDHIKSKVSNTNGNQCDTNPEQNNSKQTEKARSDPLDDKKRLGKRGGRRTVADMIKTKTRPDDIVMPIIKKKYDLEMDFSNVDRTNFADQLFDDRVKVLSKNEMVVMMTDWRRKYFEKRIRRTIPAPISLRHMSDDNEVIAYSQKLPDDAREIAIRPMKPAKLIDSTYERNIKQHNFLQYLMSSEFTDNPLDYDDEASAWAEMIWHRNYGTHDVETAPSSVRCSGCSAKIQCCDYGLDGYVPREIFAELTRINTHLDAEKRQLENEKFKCQRCRFEDVYGARLSADVNKENYLDFLVQLKNFPSSIICLVVDLTEFPCGIWENFVRRIGSRHKIIVVGNKIDLLPIDKTHMLSRVTYSLSKNLGRLHKTSEDLRVQDVVCLSARTGFGVGGLISRLLKECSEVPKDIYICGTSNSGKSTLFNALLQSDLSAIRQGDLITRVSSYTVPSSTGRPNKVLRFPIAETEEWEIETKLRKTKMVERSTAKRESNLLSTTECRQKTIPHMSMLINRLDFPPSGHSVEGSVVEVSTTDGASDSELPAKPKFTQDHPLASGGGAPEREPLGASRQEFKRNGFVYLTPSTFQEDQLLRLLTNEERMLVSPSKTIVPRSYTLRPMESIFIAGLARLDLVTATSSVNFTMFASSYLPIHVIKTRKADQFYKTFLGTAYLGVPFGMSHEEGRGQAAHQGQSVSRLMDVKSANGLRGAKGNSAHGHGQQEDGTTLRASQGRLANWPGLSHSGGDFIVRGTEWRRGACDIVLSSAGWALISLLPDQECILRAYTPEAKGAFKRFPSALPFGRRASPSLGRKLRDTPIYESDHYSVTMTSKMGR